MAAGALPVFVDVEPARWTIDPDLVEAAITPRTRAIMPVHLGQQMADMDRIMEIARRHDLFVVEDCAHAHGQRWGEQGAGTIGDFGSFSHQSTKILTAGEGGTLTTQDERLARLAHSLIDCGRPKDAAETEYTFGANYRLGELACALLVNGLRRFPAQQRAPGGARRALRAPGGRHPGRHDQAPQPADHPLELLPLHLRDRPGRVRRRDQRAGRRRDLEPRASRPRCSTRR